MIRLLLLASLMLAPVVARAQGSAPATLVTKDTITWGMSATFPPFESMADGKPIGFDVDLANALAKQMGVTSAISNLEFKGLIPAMLGKRIDAIISGMYVNAERQQVADFVVYVKVGDQIVVRSGNPLAINGPASLCGHRVAAPVATAFEVAAKKADADCKAGGKSGVALLSLPGTTTCALALKEDRADAIIVSTPTAVTLEHDTPGAFQDGGAPFSNDTEVGIALTKGNSALKDTLDKAMQGLVADGTYAALLKKWNLPAASSAF